MPRRKRHQQRSLLQKASDDSPQQDGPVVSPATKSETQAPGVSSGSISNIDDSEGNLSLLCNACQEMIRTSSWPNKPEWSNQNHHKTFWSLKQAVDQGCRICVVFYRRNLDDMYDDAAPRNSYFTRWGRSAANGYITIWPEEGRGRCEHIVAHFYPERTPSTQPQVIGPASTSTRDPSVIGVAQSWIRACLEGHRTCRGGSPRDWYPKRLLKIENGIIQLHSTENSIPTGPYTTLSHCWGTKKDFLTLNDTSIEKLTTGFAVNQLPKTFADAADITQRLGFSYIWIDSLCILQSGPSSKEDWLYHAIQMAYVYKNGILNISADAAEHPHHGIYIDRDPNLLPKIRIRQKGGAQYIFLNDLCGYAALKSSKLAARAWIVQERLLSPRILHMGNDQIFWECRELPLACECLPSGVPLQAASYAGEHPANLNISNIKHLLTAEEQDKLIHDYHEVLAHYTSCNLSFPETDKLVAFAAVAREAALLLETKCCAGLLESSIPHALLWMLKERDLRRSISYRLKKSYRAPSWSWASINGPVDSRYITLPRLAEPKILLATFTSYHPNLTDPKNEFGGLLTGTKLVLSGYLLPLDPRWDIKVNFRFWDVLHFRCNISTAPNNPRFVYTCTTYVWMDEPDFDIPRDGSFHVFLLPIYTKSEIRSFYDTAGLVLTNYGQPDGYRRVGFFRTWSDQKIPNLAEADWNECRKEVINLY